MHTARRKTLSGAWIIDTVIFNWLEAHRQYAALLIPALAFAEACVGVGLFVSGLILYGVATVMVETQLLSLWQITPLAFLGALLGDHTGYYIGWHFGPRIQQFRLAQRYQKQMQRGERLILRFGASAIFIGRFIPAIRSLLPAMLGISGFARARYSLYDTIACALWSITLAGLVAVTSGFM